MLGTPFFSSPRRKLSAVRRTGTCPGAVARHLAAVGAAIFLALAHAVLVVPWHFFRKLECLSEAAAYWCLSLKDENTNAKQTMGAVLSVRQANWRFPPHLALQHFRPPHGFYNF